MKTPKTKSPKSSQNSLAESLLKAHRNDEKRRLFREARRLSAEVPMLTVDGVLMAPNEALRYLKLRLESYQEALKRAEDVKLICPVCRNTNV